MLTVEVAIARISAWRNASRVRVEPLPGGITNLTYRVDVDEESFVVHIAGEGTELLGIDRHQAYQCAVAAGKTGVAPEVAHFLAADGVLVTHFIPGRRLTAAELGTPQVLVRLADSLRRCHAGEAFPSLFSPFRTLSAYWEVARRRGAPLPEDFDTLYRRVAAIEAACGRGGEIVRPCHNDLWEPNLLDDGTRIRILDWEYAGMGDVYFDLANFAMHSALTDAQDDLLLRSYFGSASDAAVARLRLLRIVAELREAMWAMVALHLPATVVTSFDCREYARTHFERCRHALGDRRISAWLRGSSSVLPR
jgi:thiamine kinase-like enzyme